MAKKAKKKKERSFVEAARAANTAKDGVEYTRMQTAAEIRERLVGMRLPSLSAMYLFHSNCLQWGRAIGLAGQKGVGKTAIAFEFGRLVAQNLGYMAMTATEPKPSELGSTILGAEASNRALYDEARTVEAAQQSIEAYMKAFRDNGQDHESLMILLDSLTGAPPEEMSKKLRSKGHVQRDFPLDALLWSAYIKDMVQELAKMQRVSLIFTNHLKDDPSNKTAARVQKTPGGVAQDFHATYYMHVSRIARIRTKTLGEGNHLKVKMAKCGMGPDHRVIQLKVFWDFADDGPEQFTWIDWDGSTGLFLMDRNELVNHIITVTGEGKSNPKLSCKELGLKDVWPSDLGRAVHADPDLMDRLMNALHIPRFKTFEDGKVTDGQAPTVWQGTPNMKPNTVIEESVDECKST